MFKEGSNSRSRAYLDATSLWVLWSHSFACELHFGQRTQKKTTWAFHKTLLGTVLKFLTITSFNLHFVNELQPASTGSAGGTPASFLDSPICSHSLAQWPWSCVLAGIRAQFCRSWIKSHSNTEQRWISMPVWDLLHIFPSLKTQTQYGRLKQLVSGQGNGYLCRMKPLHIHFSLSLKERCCWPDLIPCLAISKPIWVSDATKELHHIWKYNFDFTTSVIRFQSVQLLNT